MSRPRARPHHEHGRKDPEAMEPMEALSQPDAREALGGALSTWIPAQRWFQGKARTVADVAVADLCALDGRTLNALVSVTYADGRAEHYQVPLTVTPDDHRVTAAGDGDEPGAIGRLPGLRLADATGDEQACRLLAGLAADGGRRTTLAGAVVVGVPVAGGAPSAAETVRRMTAEQSNTSVVFGDASILKLFRRLEPGLNPDVEVTRGLTEAGFTHVPAQRGALELQPTDGPTTALAVLSDYVSGGREGWELACAEAAEVAAGRLDGRDTPLLGAMAELGVAIGAMHDGLRRAFGSRAATADDVAVWVADMRRQADQVLAVAAERAAGPAAGVLQRAADVYARLEQLRAAAEPGLMVRVHGDLHLGQVMLAPDGSWQLLDFEGEPARSLSERRALHTPLRDVAGMLRSFDYAAAQAALDAPALPPGLVGWRDEARRRFADGYRSVAQPAGILPADDRVASTLVAIFELDKAVYELGYELANRPTWVPIPVGGILRVLDGP